MIGSGLPKISLDDLARRGERLEMKDQKSFVREPVNHQSSPGSIFESYQGEKYNVQGDPSLIPHRSVSVPGDISYRKPYVIGSQVGEVRFKNGLVADEGSGSVVFPESHGNRRIYRFSSQGPQEWGVDFKPDLDPSQEQLTLRSLDGSHQNLWGDGSMRFLETTKIPGWPKLLLYVDAQGEHTVRGFREGQHDGTVLHDVLDVGQGCVAIRPPGHDAYHIMRPYITLEEAGVPQG